MAYIISLFKKEFLAKALKEQLGDWTIADPIEACVKESLKLVLIEAGFDKMEEINNEFHFKKEDLLIFVTFHRGEIAVEIPSKNIDKSVDFISTIIDEFADKYQLGVYSPHHNQNNDSLNKETVLELINNLKSEKEDISSQAKSAIVYYAQDNKHLVLETTKLLKHQSDTIRFSAVDVLSKIGIFAQVAIPELIDSLDDPNNWIKAGAAQALGNVGQAANKAIPKLKQLLNHEDYAVKGRAVEAIDKIERN